MAHVLGVKSVNFFLTPGVSIIDADPYQNFAHVQYFYILYDQKEEVLSTMK